MDAVSGNTISLEQFNALVNRERRLVISPETRAKVAASHEFLRSFSSDKVIYGINTGFGPMAQYRVNDADRVRLQYNLIRSHSSGAGKLLGPEHARAVSIARLQCFIQGYSGVHPEVTELLASLLEHDVLPCIFEHGGVGASGDLVQLAHLALMMIGEGDVLYKGEKAGAAETFKKLGLKPMEIRVREGLALINGTSAMTGVGLCNIIGARRLLYWSALLSSLTNELVGAYDDHFSVELNAVKHHAGQQAVARGMQRILNGSGLIRKREEHLYDPGKNQAEIFEEKVQEYYSLRCVPQVLGAIYDTVLAAEKVLVAELNSVSDNPVIDAENKNIFHGGNFHGDYVALEMDKLKIAVAKLSMLGERQLNYVLNDRLNKKFPPFLNRGTLGLNFGMQGIQFTAVSTTAENQTLGFPASLHSIPNNNDNQDIVSMGFNAAMITAKVVENAFQVLAVQFMALLQGVDILDRKSEMSPFTRKVCEEARAIVPGFVEDSPKYDDLAHLVHHMSHAPEAFHFPN
jgi:histidine ammonia-lyase